MKRSGRRPKCSQAREKLADYLEGRLKRRELRALEEHLQECERCRQELQKFEELQALLRQEVPRYWESLKPSPSFLARLRGMELPASRTPFEALVGFWQRHRQVLVAGVSICLVLVLGLTIPRLMLPKKPPVTVGSAAPLESTATPLQAPSEEGGLAERATPPPSPLAKGAVPAPTPTVVPTPTPAPAPMPSPTPPPTRTLSTEYPKEEAQEAVEIALSDPEVQRYLEGREYDIKGVHRFRYEGEDFSWDGPAVVIYLEGFAPPGASLYVCVDPEEGKVAKVLLLPERGPGPVPPGGQE